MDLSVTIPSHLVDASNGRLMAKTVLNDGFTLDFYVTPENLDKAKVQFAQARPMIEAFNKYFGEYPFPKDGYKLIEVPYTGMEHQSAVTYGNRFANGYTGRDWTGAGVSPKFDFIIIHESGQGWFGEQLSGYDDALKYVNGYKAKVQNRRPIITPRGVHRTPPQGGGATQ